MVMASPYQVRLSDTDRALLQARVRAGTTPQRMVLRALIVLMAADGTTNATIAEELGVCLDTARKWRARFCNNGVDGLADAPRSGRPPVYSAGEVARVKAWACELPATHGLPLSRWSAPELARQLVADGIGASVATVRRWLAEDALKPWQYQSWIFISDPQFAAKAAVVLDLYAHTYQGVALGADEYVISADEKPSIQARDRCHATAPADKAQPPPPNRSSPKSREHAPPSILSTSTSAHLAYRCTDTASTSSLPSHLVDRACRIPHARELGPPAFARRRRAEWTAC